jgi:hypothetical protein
MLCVRTYAAVGLTAVWMVACASAPKKPEVPALTPQSAASMLQFDNKAHNWIEYVKKHDPTCEYKLDLPDQSNQPTEIDLDHVISCGGRPSPKEYDASVVFTFDKAQQRWTVTRFSS